MNANHPQKPKQKQAGKRRKPAKKGKSAITAKKQAPDLSPEAPKPKHPGGRPPLYDTPEAIKEKIDEYFDSCWIDKVIEVTDKEGTVTATNVKYQDRPYTIEGLTWYLGFSSRAALLYYEEKPEFSDTIKRAKLKVKMGVTEGLLTGKNATGHIFWLKNNDPENYRDVQQFEHTGKDGGPIKTTDMTDEELLAIASRGRIRTIKEAKGKK